MRIAALMAIALLGACRAAAPSDPVPKTQPVNHAEIDAMLAKSGAKEEAERAARSARNPHLAGIDLLNIQAFGIDPTWEFHVGNDNDGTPNSNGTWLSDDALMAEDVYLKMVVEPVVRGDRAIYRFKGPKGAVFQVTLTPGDCREGSDRTPLIAELKIGSTIRRGCAGDPMKMNYGWD